MKFKTFLITCIFLAFLFPFSFPAGIQGQQENEDLNRRKKETEELIKRLKKARKEIEEENKRILEILEKMNSLINVPKPNPKSRFLDIYDYGPISEKHGLLQSRHINKSKLERGKY